MTLSDQKIVQYLNEAHASELALTRVLQSQIAMTPRGAYRTGLETHLRETKDHAQRVEDRLGELAQGENPLQAGAGLVQAVAGQAIALAKTPLDLLRGSGGEEKVLKNAKDAAATEALEIATYTALEHLAASVGDEKTERLAASILVDEERMLKRVLKAIPKLTEAVVQAEIHGNGSYDLSETGAADTVRDIGESTRKTAAKGAKQARRTARQARKVPGVAQAEGAVKGAVASESDLPIADYGKRSAEEIVERLPELSQVDLAKIDVYERKTDDRTTITQKISSLRADEPWAGYDELSVDEVTSALSGAGEKRIKSVRAYERRHKNRAGVLQRTEREPSRS